MKKVDVRQAGVYLIMYKVGLFLNWRAVEKMELNAQEAAEIVSYHERDF